MRKTRLGKRRAEMTDHVDTQIESYDERTEQLDSLASDHEDLRGTEDRLDLNGTIEGADAVMESFREAKTDVSHEFDSHDDELEKLFGEGREIESDLLDRSDQTENDMKKIAESADKIKLDVAAAELTDVASAEAEKDLEFTLDLFDRERDAREQEGLERDEARRRLDA